jgi:hypothetical protein
VFVCVAVIACSTAGTAGLRYFASTRVISTRETLFTAKAVDGIVMRDWLALAMSMPDLLPDAVEEGTLVGDIAGVSAFPCAIDRPPAPRCSSTSRWRGGRAALPIVRSGAGRRFLRIEQPTLL